MPQDLSKNHSDLKEKISRGRFGEDARQSLLHPPDFITRTRIRVFLIIFAFSFLVSLVLSYRTIQGTPSLAEGTYSQKNIRAPYDFEVVDETATMNKKLEAIRRSPPVLDYDSNVVEKAMLRMQGAFVDLQRNFRASQYEDRARIREIKENFLKKAGLEPEDLPADLLTESDIPTLSGYVVKLIETVGKEMITDELKDVKRLLFHDNTAPWKGEIVIRDPETRSERTMDSISRLIDVPAAMNLISKNARTIVPSDDEKLVAFVTALARNQIRPNTRLDFAETQARKKSAADQVTPVKIVYKKNQLIVGEGRNVSADQAMVLRWLSEQENLFSSMPRLFGLSLLFAILIFSAFYIADVNFPEFRIAERDFAFLGSSIIATLLALKAFVFLGDLISLRYPAFPAQAMFYLFPIAASTMLVRFVLRFEIAMTFALCTALVSGLVVQLQYPVAVYLFVSALTGAHTMGRAARRIDILKSGVFVAAVNLAMMICFSLMRENPSGILFMAVSALAGGLLSALTVIALTPLVEWIFGYMTSLSLLELANYENPLLRKIMTVTPGTFQHSVIIGALAEAAAESIGADALLCRVGALYHDAGKTLQPEWFVENQAERNPHEALNDPLESARIIKKHVADGVELARTHRVGERIADFIREHHGTGRIKYFWSKALEQAGGEADKLDESLFRYDGPKPRSKETAILIMADGIEAVSRLMTDNSYDAMNEMIDKVIASLHDGGQLDEAPVSLKELVLIREAFCRVLVGIHHNRIVYRDPSEGEPSRD